MKSRLVVSRPDEIQPLRTCPAFLAPPPPAGPCPLRPRCTDLPLVSQQVKVMPARQFDSRTLGRRRKREERRNQRAPHSPSFALLLLVLQAWLKRLLLRKAFPAAEVEPLLPLLLRSQPSPHGRYSLMGSPVSALACQEQLTQRRPSSTSSASSASLVLSVRLLCPRGCEDPCVLPRRHTAPQPPGDQV